MRTEGLSGAYEDAIYFPSRVRMQMHTVILATCQVVLGVIERLAEEDKSWTGGTKRYTEMVQAKGCS